MRISNTATLEDIKQVLKEIPPYHPISYLNARIQSNHIFVIKQEDICLGFLIYDIWWGNCPFIELIKITDDAQRKGLGSQLVDAVKNKLKSEGFSELISSSEVINEMGLNFHEKQAFKKLNTLNLPHGEEQFFKIHI